MNKMYEIKLESRRFLLPTVVVTSLLLLAKLSILRFFYFGEITASGLLKDTVSLLVIMSLLEIALPRKVKSTVFWAFNVVFSLILFAATLYQIHFNSVPTYTAFGELGQVPQIQSSIRPLIKPLHFLFFGDFVIAAIIGGIRFSGRRRDFHIQTSGIAFGSSRVVGYRWKVATAFILVLCIGFSMLFIHNGEAIDNELVKAENLGFLNFQVATAIKNKRENDLIANGNMQLTIAQVNSLQSTYPYQEDSSQAAKPAYFGSAKNMNLIIVQMEAFQNFPIHLKLEQQEITPVLNSLAKESYYFPFFYQQIGQGNTSDAEFLSNTSIYPTGKVAMSTGFGNRQLSSLPRLLHEHDYQSATFHINDVQFWSRDLLYPGLAFDHYYDKPFYNNDFFNDFGASDEEMYRVGIEKLVETFSNGKPFYAQFVTTSSHAPFVIPEDRRRLKVPADMKGTQLGNYLEAINYTDYALGQFIEQLKEKGLWDNTMLVVYGDHSGVNPKETDGKEITSRLGIPYDNLVSRFNIPLFIHVPGQGEGKVVERIGGQIDILPTVANLMGISLKEQQFTAFGRDLLNTDNNVIGMRYYLPTGSFFNNDVLFVPGEVFDDGTAISLKSLQPVQVQSSYRKDYDYIMSLMKLSDEYVQLLPKR